MSFPGTAINSYVIVVVGICCCALITLPSNSHAARILGYFPSSMKSHLLIHCAIADTLATAGHDVTVFGGAPNVYKNAKYKYIHLKGTASGASFAQKMINDTQPLYKTFVSMIPVFVKSGNESISHPLMQKFLQENAEGSIDLLILGYFVNEFHLGLGGHFKCPIIVSFMNRPVYSLNKLVGNPDSFAYVPTVVSSLRQPMNFMERVQNFFSAISHSFYLDGIIYSENARFYDLHFPASRYPSFEEVAKNVSLIFSNYHSHSQGIIRPIVPAVIEIGGIQIAENLNPLPDDIAAVLNSSTEGVIYFSLGSNVDGNILQESKVLTIFNVLSKLPYKILWKWGDSDTPGTAKNIIYKSWLPQTEILAHPNVKLFITHAGTGSMIESQYYAVPMVALPLFADQFSNAESVAAFGFGVQLDYLTLTEEQFNVAILEVIKNPKYNEAVKKFSKLYQDRPMTPRQLVTYWTEYVLRHNGAKHLQSPAVHMNLFQLLSLDIIALLATIIIIAVVILMKFCKFFYSMITKGSPSLKKKKRL